MNLRPLLLGVLLPALPAAALAQDADSPAPVMTPVVSTSSAPDYSQVTCTSSNALACADYEQLAEDTRDRLGPVLNLGKTWRFPVHIHIVTADDPLAAKINHEASAVFLQDGTLKIDAVVPDNDPDGQKYVQRQFVTALLWEKFFAGTKQFDRQTRLDIVPLWLVEGLSEWLADDPDLNREEIVRRAVANNTAPTLEEVTSWHELSDDRLLRLWQRAFSYYLVSSLIRTGPPRDDFQLWLSGFAANGSPSAQLHFPTEEDWQRELADATGRSLQLVFSWDDTLAELNAENTITYLDGNDAKDAKVKTCTLDQIATLPHTSAVTEALKERIIVLTQLELRAHPSWHEVLECYRAALAAAADKADPDRIKALLAEAQGRRAAEIDHHQKVIDYVNWFEVTKNYQDGSSGAFDTYFQTAHEMERVEADPAHPNPVRASLLQFESQL